MLRLRLHFGFTTSNRGTLSILMFTGTTMFRQNSCSSSQKRQCMRYILRSYFQQHFLVYQVRKLHAAHAQNILRLLLCFHYTDFQTRILLVQLVLHSKIKSIGSQLKCFLEKTPGNCGENVRSLRKARRTAAIYSCLSSAASCEQYVLNVGARVKFVASWYEEGKKKKRPSSHHHHHHHHHRYYHSSSLYHHHHHIFVTNP